MSKISEIAKSKKHAIAFGYHANMLFCPDNGTGIVVMQNSDIGMRICDEITNAFKEIYSW